jgi:hypothetical protein
MAQRQKVLAQVLFSRGINLQYPFLLDRSVFYNCQYHEQIVAVYKELGGILHIYPVGFGDFDIITDTCFIELDEENHFNRYRNITLKSDFYSDCSNFSKQSYIEYCNDFENKSGKGGNFWSSVNSERQFGVSSEPGNLDGNGSSRWKQRAFYDFLRDVYSFLQPKPVYRFSVYCKVGNATINTVLKKQKSEDYDAMYDLILSCISGR